MRIITVDPRTSPLWEHLLTTFPTTVFHSQAWMNALVETYAFDLRANIIVDADGTPSAGMAYARVADHKGERLLSLPFSDFCDPLVNNREDWNQVVEPLIDSGLPISLRCVHSDVVPGDQRFPEVGKAKWHGLALDKDLDTLWTELDGKGRNQIRKAEKEGVVVRRSWALTDLRAFFEMHLRVRKLKHRLLAQPYEFFEHIWSEFLEPRNGVLLLAEQADQVVGGSLFLEWNGGLYYKFNASSLSDLKARPNDLLLWEAIKYAKERDLTLLDFGLTDWEHEGLAHFKLKFGAVERKISMLKHAGNADHQVVTGQQVSAMLPALTRLLTDDRVPDDITEESGALLYRFFC